MFKSFDCSCCIVAYPHSSPHPPPPKKNPWLYRNLSTWGKNLQYNRCFSLKFSDLIKLLKENQSG